MEQQTVAILGWGSLIWDLTHPGAADFDKWHDTWQDDGPPIQLEFSRVTTLAPRQNVLTLVVDPTHGSLCTVQYCFSQRTVADDAFKDLARRENIALPSDGSIPASIGRIFRHGGSPSVCSDPATDTAI